MKLYMKKTMLFITDFILLSLALMAALVIRFEGAIPRQYMQLYIRTFFLIAAFQIAIYYFMGLYKSLWKYASIDEVVQLFGATTIGMMLIAVAGFVSSHPYPRSVYAICWLLNFLLLGGTRLSYRVARRAKYILHKGDTPGRRVMIIGAGSAGSMVIKELRNHGEMKSIPVVVIDDDRAKQHRSIHGVPVVGGREKIQTAVEKYQVDDIIIAVPSAKRRELAELYHLCKQTRCKLKTLPSVSDIIRGRVSIKHIRDVNIEDLLGRDEIQLNTGEISAYLENEIVMVTGGGGSIGSELCRQIALFHPRKLIILDIYENNAYDLQNELLAAYKEELHLEVVIASVRDKNRLEQIFSTYRPGVVFHAAAHKHVPLMEANPAEAIKNNVMGTLHTAQCADKYGVKKFVLISTDKAVNPTNIMGATKRVAEMIIQSMDKQSKTEFVAVRFGNVLGSNGSVIPLFKKQIAHGGPVTVTHPEITRFFMTIPEAARLVIQAGAMAEGGEIFILDMGEPVKIVDLARDLIRLSGFEPEVDIKIAYTGLRPGEKLYEELLLSEEGIESTKHPSIFVGKPLELSYNEVLMQIQMLESCLQNGEQIRECMQRVVPTYRYEKGKKDVKKAREEIAAGLQDGKGVRKQQDLVMGNRSWIKV